MLLLLLLSCTSLICGPGTEEVEGSCLPLDEADTDTDTDADSDSDADTDSDTDTDSAPVEEVLDVYILAGQSNMAGISWYTGLSPDEQLADPRVQMYWSGWGEFRSLQPASPYGNIYFGPEVTFGRAMADARPQVALVKHAVGGTDLAAYWYPGEEPGDASAGEGFAGLTAAMKQAELELEASGVDWRWAGFVWMQGESDSLDADMAAAYEDNLAYLVASVRELSGEPELPAAIGLIATESIWTWADTVREAQQAVADEDPFVFTVETDDLPRNELDLAHYDGVSMRVMGARFAQALLEEGDVPAGDDAPQPALVVTAGSSPYTYTGTVGWEFTLDRALTLTDVGSYGATYITTSADLGIWDESGDLVLRANVPGWYDAPATWLQGFWYVAVEPILLEAGTYRVGVVSWEGDSDVYLTFASGSFAEGIDYSAGVYGPGNWLTYPSNSTPDDGTISYLGPNFLFVP